MSYSFRLAVGMMAFVASTILFVNISSRSAVLAAPVKPPYRGTPMGQGAKMHSYSAPQSMAPQAPAQMPVQQQAPATAYSPPAQSQGDINIHSSGISSSSGLPYRAEQIGIEAALELANRKRDVRAVRLLERAKTGAGMPSSSAVSAQLRSSPPNFESTPQAQPPAYSSSPPPVFATNSGPLPYNAEQVGIGAAIEMALRKKDTRAVRILQWAREEMQSQMAASPHY
mmetsp:Transcript_36954/g.59242  ORF Transcript_36954/g.59242 Transcript_36954/m.59242 type:complete len:227 (-) Transcript_36954:421-1101(-)